jgi:Protein of unknown function (DUF433)/Domain of unknown function (DUF5615)
MEETRRNHVAANGTSVHRPDDQILGGEPVIDGTRTPVRAIVELYTDEDVDVLIADLLRARGFNVLTTQDAGRLHATDEEQLAFCGR